MISMGKAVLKRELSEGLYKIGPVGASGCASSFGLRSDNKIMPCSVMVQSSNVNMVSKTIMHRRFGHPFSKVSNEIVKFCNLPVKVIENVLFCEACKFGKSHALPFSLSTLHASASFELIPSNLWGSTSVMSTNGYRYYVHFLDDYNRFVWIYPLKLKSDIVGMFYLFYYYG